MTTTASPPPARLRTPRSDRSHGQWAVDGRAPLNPNEAMKQAGALGTRVYSINQNYSWGQDMEQAIVDNASLGVVERSEGAWHLTRWNDTRHLAGATPIHVDESEGRPLAL